VALHVGTEEYRKRHPLPFLVLPGATDYMLPALIARQHGCIGGPYEFLNWKRLERLMNVKGQLVSEDLRQVIQDGNESTGDW
jgi:hypothetical protein